MTTGSEPSGNPPSYPQNGTYADLLVWHMDIWGTRPGGNTTAQGRPWYPQDFRKEVFGNNSLSESARVLLDNWRGGGNPPDAVNAGLVEAALFGQLPAFQNWRIDLRLAHKRSRGKGNNRRTEKKLEVAVAVASTMPSTLLSSTTARFIVRDPHALDLESKMAAYEESAQLFKHAGNTKGQGEALIGVAETAVLLEQYDKSHNAYLAALMAFGKADDKAGQAKSYFGLGNIEVERHDFYRAEAEYKNALHLFNEIWDRKGQSDCYYRIAITSYLKRDYYYAHRNAVEAMSLRIDLGDRKGEGECLAFLATIYSSKGNTHEAIRTNREALAIFKEVGTHELEATCSRAISALEKRLLE